MFICSPNVFFNTINTFWIDIFFHGYFFEVLSLVVSDVQSNDIEFQVLLQDKLCKATPSHTLSHPPRCPALAPFAINLVHCSLPVRNYGFYSRRILFHRTSHSFDLLASYSFSFWSSRKMIAPLRRYHEKRTRTRGNSDIADLCVYIYHMQRTITHTYAWYFVIKYTINAMSISKPQNTHRTQIL